ncbi:uncharacterized protein LOC116177359 [Photinus pyralis]|uniref:uncharacterized protein LOC116177359 n=1 Tax=Photinus pyralis TaxID=7054 RepID=UPI0012671867|nr:uncharacterized protein LOC116177359 [Photinus pyralis]
MCKNQKATLNAGNEGASRTRGDLPEQCQETKISETPATNSIVNAKSNISNERRFKSKSISQNQIEETVAKNPKRLKGGYAEDRTVQQAEVVKYFSGGPPVYSFADEIWRKGLEKKQEKYRENLRTLQIENKKFMKRQVAAGHNELMALVGPDWFQELSPNQLKAADNLKNCILKDKRYKCITYTKDNIGELGLVLRPNQRHIKKALNNCCECPVEFLLILYQLMNQKRTEYSINDRLLLSAVAHLTMRETLKELHIRIPSPPRSPRKPNPVLEQPPKPRYKSPYLATFDFVPCPRKYTGVYKNKHVQHPESPYFAYITELKQERAFENDEKRKTYIQRKQSGITVDQQKEILAELKSAQKIYESLVDFEPVPYLLKPSIYIPCDHVAKLPEELAMGHEETELEQKDLSIPIAFEDPPCDELCGMEEQQIEPEKITSEVLIVPDESIEQPKSVPEGEMLVVARVPSLGCTCKEDVEESIKTNLCHCAQCTARRQELSTGTCKCMAVYETKLQIYEKLKQRFDAQQGLISMPKPYVVGGITYTYDGQPVYMLSGVAPELECCCAAIQRDQLLEEQRRANMPTIPLGKQKYVISGVQSTDKGNVFVVSSAVPTEDCTCMKLFKAYQERHVQCLEVYQKYLEKMRIDVHEYMLEMTNDPRFQEEITNDPRAQEELTNDPRFQEAELPAIEEQVEESKPEDQTTMQMCSTVRSTIVNGGEDVQLAIESGAANVPKCECGGEDPCSNSIIYLTGDAIQATCICTKPPPVCDEACGKIEDEPESDSEMSDLYRFIILNKMPSNYDDQMNILKTALRIMADDGFPLAKLPDSWSLPIFRLWMDMRCRRYWTQEDRLTFYEESMRHWNHLIYCDRSITAGARLDMSTQKARQYTWAHAYSVRKIAATKENIYYRQVKQVAINEAREFFPSTFSYELPTPNFRDCFFAYAPAKEDDCTYFRPWFSHEFKKK